MENKKFNREGHNYSRKSSDSNFKGHKSNRFSENKKFKDGNQTRFNKSENTRKPYQKDAQYKHDNNWFDIEPGESKNMAEKPYNNNRQQRQYVASKEKSFSDNRKKLVPRHKDEDGNYEIKGKRSVHNGSRNWEASSERKRNYSNDKNTGYVPSEKRRTNYSDYGNEGYTSSERKRNYNDDKNTERVSFERRRTSYNDYGNERYASSERKRNYNDDKNTERVSFERRRTNYSDSGNKGYTSSERKRNYHDDQNTENSSFGRKQSYSDNRKFENRSDKKFDHKNKYEKFNKEKEYNNYERRPYSKFKNSNPEQKNDGSIRLNKYIANAGICSRREADVLIASGAVSVNGVIITQMGFKVQPDDVVNYGGERLVSERKRYILLNKPKGFITTSDDPQNRKTVMMLIEKACTERVYPVGRLDRNTTGLLLFTNDGEMAKKLTHPSTGARKLYHVELDKPVTKADIQRIMDGIMLEDGEIIVDDIQYAGNGEDKRIVGVELHSGRNRIVRRIFESMGYEIYKLDRVLFAGLNKKDLPRGRCRMLNEKEISFLKML